MSRTVTTRTPLRITLGGGGTDLPSYSDEHGGFVISAAIDKYVYVALERLERGYDVNGALASTLEDVTDPFVRQAFTQRHVGPAKVTSRADLPSGSGLGSSGSFTVGLLRALEQELPVAHLAEAAFQLEAEQLGRPVGRQDPYIASFGGVQCFEFARGGKVTVTPLALSADTHRALDENLLLFFTGATRNAAVVLDDQRSRTKANDPVMLEQLHQVKASGHAVKQALEHGDVRRFGALMHEHWEHKRRRSPGMSNGAIDRWYELGMHSGALGGKLVGAGGGGFLLFYTEHHAALREAMTREGLREVEFRLGATGSRVA